jgi:NSS family neurotransmitter:Na+ symporter
LGEVDSVKERESLATRLGFILVSAGCAIGLGNVWRFPFITGRYGGAAFVIMYLLFLVILGLPVMVAEFAMGRASRRNLAGAMRVLEPKGSKWHIYGYIGVLGNLILMMFYTVVSGWFFAYLLRFLTGKMEGLSPEEVGAAFGGFLGNTPELLLWTIVVIALGYGVCAMGLRSGVERAVKFLMSGLFLLMILLAVRAITLPGAEEGLAFYLKPDFSKLTWESVYAAMSQAFFTLSLGIGSMLIFGSYIGKERSLAGESVYVFLLDTAVALLAGFIIFPACFAFGVDPGAGPGLIFVSLPNIFNEMVAGRFWGSLFFLFMVFATMTTVIAVFEHLVAFCMDEWNWGRKKASVVLGIITFVTAIPCALGFGPWSGFAPFGPGTVVLDLEDFIVSFNLLPIGSLLFVIFCTTRYGWGWDNFIKEANTGKGLKFPVWLRPYMTYVLPVLVLALLILGYIDFFS